MSRYTERQIIDMGNEMRDVIVGNAALIANDVDLSEAVQMLSDNIMVLRRMKEFILKARHGK